MSDYKATAQTTAFVLATKKRMNALVLQSTTNLINRMQTPVAKGGKMRVDTGFLRASGQLSLTGLPTGPGLGRKRAPGEPKDSVLYPTKNAAITDLANFQVGRTIYFGWTAKYAKYREAYDGFLAAGVQSWQSIVDDVAAQIKRRSPGSKG